MSEASPKAESQQTAPIDWSAVPLSHRRPLITLLIELVQRRLANQGAEKVIGDERQRTQAAG